MNDKDGHDHEHINTSNHSQGDDNDILEDN